jgi:hypothetical protein
MAVIAAVVLTQKLLPDNAAVDVRLAPAILVAGIWILIAPTRFPN